MAELGQAGVGGSAHLGLRHDVRNDGL